MQHLQPNTTLQGGKYRIERVLGQGGFGNTYVGINTTFEDKVAIKEFFMQGINDRDEATGSITISIERNKQQFQEQLEKFKKEALRIRKLDNPHIVKVHDLFEENGTAYYVMDYVDGENLAERLKRTGKPMSEQEVRAILPQILDALKSVHDAGIWHLDLKPANIMVDKDGNVKLIDFGASKQLNVQKGGATTSTAISYTNGYAPREQMEQNYEKFGPWTDVYALGATLYALLTNKRPPLPTDIDDDVSDDKHYSLPLPESKSEEMKSLILWMMQTDKNQRPQDVDSVLSKMTMVNQPAKDEDIDECTIIDALPEIQNVNSYNKSMTTKSRGRLKFYIWLSLLIILLSFLGIVIWDNYDGKRNIKPNYRVISEKDKTCELVGDIDSYDEESEEFKYVIRYVKNLACIRRDAYGDYIIPSIIDGNKVVKLGAYSFSQTNLSSVIVPEEVKEVERKAFSYCENLVSVTLPNGVISIGAKCFENNSMLTEIELPETIIEIGSGAFMFCSSLNHINIPQRMTILSDSLFLESGITSIHLPNSIRKIGSSIFRDCQSLSSINIPEGIEVIPGFAFAGCSSLRSILLPSSIKLIEDRAFDKCESLSSINIPEGVEEIWLEAFDGCSSLASIYLPKTIEKISGYFPDRTKTVISDIRDPFIVKYINNYPNDFSPGSYNDWKKESVLYIPKGTKDLYIKAGWTKHFSKVIER